MYMYVIKRAINHNNNDTPINLSLYTEYGTGTTTFHTFLATTCKATLLGGCISIFNCKLLYKQNLHLVHLYRKNRTVELRLCSTDLFISIHTKINLLYLHIIWLSVSFSRHSTCTRENYTVSLKTIQKDGNYVHNWLWYISMR